MEAAAMVIELDAWRRAKHVDLLVNDVGFRQSWRMWRACQRIDKRFGRLTIVQGAELDLDSALIDRLEDLAAAICAVPLDPNAP
jgi:hypothetical protein